MKVKVTSEAMNKNRNLVMVEVLDPGSHQGNEYPMWVGEVHKPWLGRELKIGDIVEASEMKLDELEEEYLTYNRNREENEMNQNPLENNNIRTMELLGVDDWARPVYKCIETGDLYKDITLGSDNPELYSCSNDFDGEPGFPIKDDLEIRFKEPVQQVNENDKFNYQLLGRLRSDCDFYLGHGNRNAKHLWANDEKEQIEKMKELYNGFSDDGKPEWLTFDQILEYEKQMINN